MLIFNRREGQDLQFTGPEGRTIKIVVEEIHQRRVKISVHAPDEIRVLRGELVDRPPDAVPNNVRHDARRTIVPFPRHR